MDTGGTNLAFASEEYYKSDGLNLKPNRVGSESSGFEISLVTDDVYKAFNASVENGAIKIIEPHEKPWGQIVSCVKDNNGILVSICNWPAKEIKVTGE